MVFLLYGSAGAALVYKHEGILFHKLNSGTQSSPWDVLTAQVGFLKARELSFFQDASYLYGEKNINFKFRNFWMWISWDVD